MKKKIIGLTFCLLPFIVGCNYQSKISTPKNEVNYTSNVGAINNNITVVNKKIVVPEIIEKKICIKSNKAKVSVTKDLCKTPITYREKEKITTITKIRKEFSIENQGVIK